MKTSLHLFFAFLISVGTAHAAKVDVAPHFQGGTRLNEVVRPGQYSLLPIAHLNAGDQISIKVEVLNAVYNDLTVCIATEAEAKYFPTSRQCRGVVRGRAPIVIDDRAYVDGGYVLILDNSYAAMISKKVAAQIEYRKTLTPSEVEAIKKGIVPMHNMISSTFENSDFDVQVRPCGQSNAFSSNRTGDITLCSELIHELTGQRNPGAIVATLLHEYGHSLLNRWGEPGSSEEDMADQFATAVLLHAGDAGRQALKQWIAYWLNQDSRGEAEHQLRIGDTHTLSIQRARNIQRNMDFPEDFIRRWNKMLYRHMTREGLERTIAKPTKADDVDLATEALHSKQQVLAR